jgi:Asp-tRNA(Asn)/Glu-tRNA(Gln) amidotransferase A subunit family amidase
MGPHDTADWQTLSACRAIDAIRGGTMKADALMRRTLAAIDAGEPAIGAFVQRLADLAAVQQAAQAVGPLHGLPIAVKDIFDTQDLPTAYGSPLYDDGRCARGDAAIVGAIRAAGGVIVGKTTTTEFAYLQPTATRNPVARGRTPGGSSAGSAAAVAAGMVPWAIGTQTGGSTIRPASFCGIVGFKPSFGLLPTAGLKCFSWSLDTVGLFARDVTDVAWLAQALSGRALALPAAPRRAAWTVGVPRAYPWSAPSENAQRAVERAARAWQEAGATILAIDLPPFVAELDAAHAAIQGWEATRTLAAEAAHVPDLLSPLLRAYLEGARAIDGASYARAQHGAAHARQCFADALLPCDVLLMPSAPDEAPLGLLSTGASDFNRAWTLLGVPCVNVPGLFGSNGAPMGVQLIAAADADGVALQAAGALEAALNVHAPPP